MSNPHQYISLVTSLPHLGKLFSQKQVPISEFRLKQRLASLDTDHRQLLKEMAEATTWSGVADAETDGEVIGRAKTVIDKLAEYPDLQHLVGGRMETRTLIAALRRRKTGQESADNISEWGYGRWCGAISSNWSDPGFGLSHFMPWIAEAHRLLQSEDHIGMERLVLTQVYHQLDHYAHSHEFDFEAVCIYVLRWIIVERWSSYDTGAAHDRLEDLLSSALGNAREASDGPRPELFSRTDSPVQRALP